MRQFVIFQCLVLLLLTAAPRIAMAQSVVGETVINGRQVELLDNNTWRYADDLFVNTGRNCETLEHSVVFCNSLNWQVSEPVGAATAIYLIDDRTYVMLIIEGIGSNDGASPEMMVNAAHWFASQAMNIQQDSLEVHYTRPKRAGRYEYTTTAYSGKIDGLSFTYINNIYIGRTFNMQAVVYNVGGLSGRLEEFSDRLTERLSFGR